MGQGGFKQPPPGPKIGPVKDYAELPQDQKEELGKFVPPISAPRVEAPAAEPPVPPALDAAVQAEVLQRVLADTASDEVPVDQPDQIALQVEAQAQPTDADKQEFLRCVLGGKEYRKTYELFGGAVRVHFVDMTVAATDAMFSTMAEAQQQPDVIQTEDDWDLMLERVRLLFVAEQIQIGAKTFDRNTVFDPDMAGGPRRSILNDANALLAQIGSATTYRAILHALRIFLRHLELLVERAFDSDFWRAAGVASPSAPTSAGTSTTAAAPAPAAGR